MCGGCVVSCGVMSVLCRVGFHMCRPAGWREVFQHVSSGEPFPLKHRVVWRILLGTSFPPCVCRVVSCDTGQYERARALVSRSLKAEGLVGLMGVFFLWMGGSQKKTHHP